MSTREKIKEYFEQNGPAKHTTVARFLGVSRQRVAQIVREDYELSKKYDELCFELSAHKRDTGGRRRKYGANMSRKDFFASNLRSEQSRKLAAKKANARRAGISFEIEYGDLYWPTHCPILGLELDYFAAVRQENSPSFDRLDSSKGYTKDNTVVISWRANRIKNDGTADEHRQIATYLDTALRNVTSASQE